MATGELAPGRTEPRGITTADLIALTAGVALVVEYNLLNPYLLRPRPGGPPLGAGSLMLGLVYEGLSRGPLALLPVIFARRIRHGGPLSAPEFFAATSGWITVFSGLSMLPVWGIVQRDPSTGWAISWGDRHVTWRTAELIIGLLGLILGLGLRKRLAPWASMMLISFFWIAITPLQIDLGQYLQPWIPEDRIAFDMKLRALWLAIFFPLRVLSQFPMFVALFSLRSPSRPPLCWYQGLMLLMCLASLLLTLRTLVWRSSVRVQIRGQLDLGYEWAALAVAVAIAFWLTRDRSKQDGPAIADYVSVLV